MIVYDLRELQKQDISFYLGLEYVLTEESLDDDIFFLWDINKSIIVGKHQLINTEVNIEYAKSIGCKIYRRPSGGGAVYADDGCFMFSFISKEKNTKVIYHKFLSIILNCLHELGINSEFSGRNDLLFQGKKFSGNAIYFRNDYSIIHGTILFDSDLESLVRVLTPNDEKLISKGIKSVKERVINLKNYFPNTNYKKYDLMRYITTYLYKNNNGKLVTLDENIKTKINEHKKEFDNDSWIYQNNPEYIFQNKKTFSWGSVNIFINIKKEKISSLTLTGDFFSKRNINEFLDKFIGCSCLLTEVEKVLQNVDINEYIENANNNDFLDLMFENNLNNKKGE